MPAFDVNRFFEDTRDWQWIKHTIFAEYIHPWATIVGKYDDRIHIVDAFAGAGTFTSPDGKTAEGTPMLAAKQAIGYNKKHEATARRCDLTCVEMDRANFQKLQALLLPRFRSCVSVLEGDYESHVDAILKNIGDDPLLLLLDPIGLKAISEDRIAPLIRRKGKTDVFLTLHFGIVHRAAGFLNDDGSMKPEKVAASNLQNVDRFFNTAEWREVMLRTRRVRTARQDVELELVELFFRSVAAGRYEHCSAYPVRSQTHEAPRYWLAHLCDHPKAFWLMNDLVAKVDALLLDRTYEDEGALPGLGAAITEKQSEVIEDELRADVLRLVARHPDGVEFGSIEEHFAKPYFGRVRRGAYARVVKTLVKSGDLARENEKAHAKLEPRERITSTTGKP